MIYTDAHNGHSSIIQTTYHLCAQLSSKLKPQKSTTVAKFAILGQIACFAPWNRVKSQNSQTTTLIALNLIMPSHFSLKLAVKLSELKISKKSLRWHTTINSPIDLHTKLGQFEGLWIDPGVGSGYELYITGKLTT